MTALCGNGLIKIYDGTQATNANTAVGAQNNLATLTFGGTAFQTPTASGSTVTATANSILSDTNAAGGGTAATWFRVLKSDGVTVVFDGSVAATGGTADLILNTTSIVTGATVSCSSFTIQQSE